MYISENVLITGGCGFIASNFLNYMVLKYPKINFVNIDCLYPCSHLQNIKVLKESNYKFIEGNLSNKSLIDFILINNKIDTVIHFAAQSHVDNSFANPIQYSQDNYLCTHILLEACRNYGKITRFIHVSTDEVYGESLNVVQDSKKKEDHAILCPTNPYAASKAAAEMMISAYYHSFKFPVIITRGNNVYGRNQYPEKLIPKFILTLLNNEKCTIHGNGNQRRNFIHVDDVCRAFETILNKGRIGEIYNIESKEEFSVLEIAKKLINKIKPGEDVNNWINFIEDRPFNDYRYYICGIKLLDLGWKEIIEFEDGLNETIDWYTYNADRWNNVESKNKFMVFGGNGWIGSKVLKILKDMKENVYKCIIRADNKELVEMEIDKYKPTHIICMIGRTSGAINGKEYTTIDYLEQKGTLRENIRDNLFSPIVLALLCKKYNIHLTYMGTGCIYKYEGDIKFNEDSKPNFFGSSYSIMKGYTDELMHLFPDTVLNVRIRMPITSDKHPKNFISKITKYEKICSIDNSMTVLKELLPLMIDMAINKQVGTINLTNPGVISHNEILEMYTEIVDPTFEWKNFTEEEQRKILDADRSNNYLDTSKLELLYPKVNNIKDAVRKCLIETK